MNVDIIGGGLSGLSSAISLKEHDPTIHVTVHEKYKTIGYNYEGRRCAEAYGIHKSWVNWNPDEKSIFNKICKWELIMGEKTLIVPLSTGTQYILNRQEFISKLAQEAENLGVNFMMNDKIRSIRNLKSDFIIDASGCPSTVKRELGLPQGLVGGTYQHTIEGSNCFIRDTMKFYVAKEGGYYWIFPRDPKKREVNVGIAMYGSLKHNLKPLLEKFKLEQNIDGQVNYIVGGFVPLGIQHPLRYDNILFIGDAGIGAGVLSGAGIHRALISGHIAGKYIAKQSANKYTHMIKKMFRMEDMIGISYIKINNFLNKINPNLILKIAYMTYKSLNKTVP